MFTSPFAFSALKGDLFNLSSKLIFYKETFGANAANSFQFSSSIFSHALMLSLFNDSSPFMPSQMQFYVAVPLKEFYPWIRHFFLLHSCAHLFINAYLDLERSYWERRMGTYSFAANSHSSHCFLFFEMITRYARLGKNRKSYDSFWPIKLGFTVSRSQIRAI